MSLEKMIEEQLIAQGIHDQNVIAAFRAVDRKLFVPPESQSMAYANGPLPIGHNQTISQPFIVAYMLEKLKIKPKDKILEIGTGSGYQTAILANMCKELFTVEIIKPLLIQAQDRLKKLTNINFKLAGDELGWKENQPYDKIVVSAAASKLPTLLVSQLKLNGSMIVPVGEYHQELILVHRNQDDMKFERLIPVRFVPLL